MKLKIASRKSDLARLQSYSVGRALQDVQPDLEVEYLFSSSAGDRDQDRLLSSFGDKGAFTQDFYQGLVDGDFDMVVHSWKDLPTEERDGTEVACTLDREDTQDLLLFKKTRLDEIRNSNTSASIQVLTSSPRRKYNLQSFLPDHLPFDVGNLEFNEVRGNIQTRIDKLIEGEADALVVAKAALDRLLSCELAEFREAQAKLQGCLRDLTFMILPLEHNPTAAAQGALAVEVSKNNSELKELLSKVDRAQHRYCVETERQILSDYGGGCHQKIGITICPKSGGYVQFEKGETEEGMTFSSVGWRSPKLNSVVMPTSLNEIYPRPDEKANLFDRDEIKLNDEKLESLKSKNIFVGRANALPENLELNSENVLWVSGTRSWKKLADRGHWVHGCNDGMGMEGLPYVGHISGTEKSWVKLTHSKGASEDGMDTEFTYQLVEKSDVEDISDRKYFYWMSGSQFEWALNKWPSIKSAYHFCGLGKTHEQITRILGTPERVIPFYSLSLWQDWMSDMVEEGENYEKQ